MVAKENIRKALDLYLKMETYLGIIGVEPKAFGLFDMAGMSLQEAEVFLEKKKVRRCESSLRLLSKARAINDEIVAMTEGEMDYTKNLDEVERIIRS